MPCCWFRTQMICNECWFVWAESMDLKSNVLRAKEVNSTSSIWMIDKTKEKKETKNPGELEKDCG